MSKSQYLFRRLALALFVPLGVLVITFILSRIVPGDPVLLYAGPRTLAEERDAIRAQLGLDQPLPAQFVDYVGDVLHGDLGISLRTKRPITDDLRLYLPTTLELVILSILLALALGIPVGVLSAARREGVLDRAGRFFSIAGVSVPAFWLALLLQMLFFSLLGWLPLSGRLSRGVSLFMPVEHVTGFYLIDAALTGNWVGWLDATWHLVLPVIVLATYPLGLVVRMVRTAMKDNQMIESPIMTPITWRERIFGARPAKWREPGTTLWYFRRDRLAVIGLIFLLLIVLAAIFAPYLAPYPDQGLGAPNTAQRFSPPSTQHLLGTDQLGRDVLSRLIFGARTSLVYGFAVVFIAMAVGTALGAVAGYFGGLIDELIMRITDIFLAFPPLLLAIVIASVLSRGVGAAVFALSLTWWPWYTRLVRGQALSLRERAFVRAARNIGVGDLTIVRRHILPNVLTPVLVQGTLDLGAAILTAAGLSFLGLGTQSPTADWGMMISEGRSYLLSGFWWIATFAGLAIFLTTLAFNLLGDGVQVAIDPQQQGG